MYVSVYMCIIIIVCVCVCECVYVCICNKVTQVTMLALDLVQETTLHVHETASISICLGRK